jgi:hypothetical protein
MAQSELTWRVVHFALDPGYKAYRAYFEKGGYRDCETLQEARSAFSPMRGPAVRVERIDTHVLWLREPQTDTQEGS